MKEIYSEIEIQATAHRVWEVLTDFASFPQWNPFIRRAGGRIRAGERLDIRVQPPGERGMTFRPTVLRRNRPGASLGGRFLIPGLFEGEHVFTLDPIGTDRVRFIQRERFKGLLVPLLAAKLDAGTRRGFEEMNRALKARLKEGDGIPEWTRHVALQSVISRSGPGSRRPADSPDHRDLLFRRLPSSGGPVFQGIPFREKILERHRKGEILVVEKEGKAIATGSVVAGEIFGVFVHPGFQKHDTDAF
jgi:hypothetical protein